ncbi:unnamed protein product [Pleuronectes platessa]|uniref:Uncharacterized protein n=1 Tax=Pleuronectes platessa TaxID=8262 RepID=A0A9N7YHW3_PLEPL|nr:unnamed protein product [Pleuronectes platessa]
MTVNLAPRSRHVSSSLSLFAAVMLCIVCSDAARASASPISSQANSGVRQNFRSSLFPSNDQHRPLSTGRLSPEPGTSSGTEMGRKSGEALSITSHQSNPPWYTGGSFSYNPNSPDRRQQSRGELNRAPKGHSSAINALDTSAFRSNPRSETVAQRLSVTDFSLRLNPMTSGDTSRPKMVQSHPLKDSQASSMVTGKDRTLEKFVPAPQAVSQDDYATSREKDPGGNSVLTASGSDQASVVSPPSPFTSGLKDVQPLLPESFASPEMNPDPTEVTAKARSGFTARPLEGAKPAVREPSRRATRWQGVDIVSSQTWPPKRINTWKKDTGDVEAESDSPSPRSQKEQSSEDVKPKYEHSRFTPDKYKKKPSLYTFMGFQSLQDKVGSPHWNSITAATPTSTDSSSYLPSAAGLHLESSPTTEPRTHDKTKPVVTRARQFYRTPGRTGIGKRVLAKPDESQNLSGSSFPANDTVDVAIAGRPKTPMTPADKKDSFPRAPAEARQEEGPNSWTSDDRVLSGKNTSRGAKDEEGDFSRIEEKTLGIQSRASEAGMKTVDDSLANEGSGSGAFSGSDVLSADRPQSQSLTEDLLEFDYLRTATGNISFREGGGGASGARCKPGSQCPNRSIHTDLTLHLFPVSQLVLNLQVWESMGPQSEDEEEEEEGGRAVEGG